MCPTNRTLRCWPYGPGIPPWPAAPLLLVFRRPAAVLVGGLFWSGPIPVLQRHCVLAITRDPPGTTGPPRTGPAVLHPPICWWVPAWRTPVFSAGAVPDRSRRPAEPIFFPPCRKRRLTRRLVPTPQRAGDRHLIYLEMDVSSRPLTWSLVRDPASVRRLRPWSTRGGSPADFTIPPPGGSRAGVGSCHHKLLDPQRSRGRSGPRTAIRDRVSVVPRSVALLAARDAAGYRGTARPKNRLPSVSRHLGDVPVLYLSSRVH